MGKSYMALWAPTGWDGASSCCRWLGLISFSSWNDNICLAFDQVRSPWPFLWTKASLAEVSRMTVPPILQPVRWPSKPSTNWQHPISSTETAQSGSSITSRSPPPPLRYDPHATEQVWNVMAAVNKCKNLFCFYVVNRAGRYIAY